MLLKLQTYKLPQNIVSDAAGFTHATFFLKFPLIIRHQVHNLYHLDISPFIKQIYQFDRYFIARSTRMRAALILSIISRNSTFSISQLII